MGRRIQGARCLHACMHSGDRQPAALVGARRGARGRCALEGKGRAPRTRRPGGAASSLRCAARRTRAAPAGARRHRELRPQNRLPCLASGSSWLMAAGCWTGLAIPRPRLGHLQPCMRRDTLLARRPAVPRSERARRSSCPRPLREARARGRGRGGDTEGAPRPRCAPCAG